jgi:hypothetical protein
VSDWFRALFGEPDPPKGVCDCDDCKAANPDWYRMGMEARKPKPRDLSRVDPSRFLDNLLWLRDHHPANADDEPSNTTLDELLHPKPKQPTHLIVGDSVLNAMDFKVEFDLKPNWKFRSDIGRDGA